MLDLYDHEVIDILKVQEALRERAASGRLNYNAFEREIRDRFARIGFMVDVNWYRFGHERPDGTVEEADGAAMPEITVTGRADAVFAFDPDRQVHEATRNILDLPGQTGVIKTDPGTVRDLLKSQKRHGHGHGHHR